MILDDCFHHRASALASALASDLDGKTQQPHPSLPILSGRWILDTQEGLSLDSTVPTFKVVSFTPERQSFPVISLELAQNEVLPLQLIPRSNVRGVLEESFP